MRTKTSQTRDAISHLVLSCGAAAAGCRPTTHRKRAREADWSTWGLRSVKLDHWTLPPRTTL